MFECLADILKLIHFSSSFCYRSYSEMSTCNSTTNTSGIRNDTPPKPSLPSLNRRRDKPQLSCNPCKRRKYAGYSRPLTKVAQFLIDTRSKCNRQQPCTNCSSRGMSLSCIYADASIHSTMQSPVSIGYDQKLNPTASITDRIQQLENLVVTLMKDNSANVSQSEPQVPLANPVVSNPSNTVTSNSMPEDCGETIVQDPASPPGLGRIKVSTSSTSYVSNAHWAAVLDGISDLKDCFEKEDDSPQPEYASPQLLYGSLNRASKSEILSSIPPRPVVDRLVSRYFNALDMAPGRSIARPLQLFLC